MKDQVDYQRLLVDFFAGEITDDEIARLQTWLESDAENRRKFDIENELWQNSSFQVKFEQYKSQTVWNNLSANLGLGNKNSRSLIILKKRNYRILLAAASITLMLAVGGISLWIAEKSISRNVPSSLTLVNTKEGEKSRILLSDSTSVILNSGSSLQYAGNYNRKDRSVNLTGEAFFDVHTNPGKPFVVHIDQMTISATGTRFNVLAYPDDDRVETTLEEGEIQVDMKGHKLIHVKRGQQVVFLKETKEIRVRDVATDTYTSWKENILRFSDTPFEEVMRKLSRNYNVEIEVMDQNLFDLNYTATFIDESIEDVMQMFSAVSPITYKIYNRTSVDDSHYVKPRIVVGEKKNFKIVKPNTVTKKPNIN